MRKIAGEFERPLAELEEKIAELEGYPDSLERQEQIKELEAELAEKRKEVFKNLTRWERTLLARAPNRPYTYDYIRLMFKDFVELHGDRRYADDRSIISGFAFFRDQPVCVIGHQKGRDTKEKLYHNFGMPHPEGYRKALRVMKIADKFQRPIMTFVDTPGAFPGIGAEERGQAEAIAYNLREMGKLTVPVIVTITGEGGSGGALAIAIGNRVNILENSIYSVISPEGCAAILWKDAAYADKAADAMKLTPNDLLAVDLVDKIIPEPSGGAHTDHLKMAAILAEALWDDILELKKLSREELVQDRFEKFRKMGKFIEETTADSAQPA
jgi:acetyl-CoA carboxylase carboxyl transferase subunit alpha